MSSGPDFQRRQRPVFLFAAVGLVQGSGGIAELSRQVLRTLLDMHHKGLIDLKVHVLEDSGPQPGDELFKDSNLPEIRWYAGNRWKFTLSLILAKSDIQLLDHVGLARLDTVHGVTHGGVLPAH